MKFFSPRAGGQKRNKIGRNPKEEVKFYQKVTSCGNMFLKELSLISSKGNSGEMQNLL